MGLDMYLYTVNKKAKNTKELEEMLNTFKQGPSKEKVEAYNLLMEGKAYEAAVKLNPWRAITISDYSYNKEDNQLKYRGSGISLSESVKNLEESIQGLYERLVPVVEEFLNAPDRDEAYVQIDNIHYWRKHPDLHGYFEEIFYDRGGEGEFNCKPVILTKEDIEELLENIQKQVSGEDVFRRTSGFFFGETCQEDWEDDLEFFTGLLKKIDWDKETVYYSSWW